MAVQKRKRVSKKSKHSWRKHSNIEDVEEYLEKKRLEERLGPPLETLPNEALFKIDNNPSKELLPSDKERRRLKIERPPRCFAILQPFTQVPDPIKKRNRVRTQEERKNELIKKREERERLNGVLRHRKRQAAEDHKKFEENKMAAPKRGDFVTDVWEEEKKTPLDKQEWVDDVTKQHHKIGTGKLKKRPVKSLRIKSSHLPAVEAPHPGTSYNPSYDDHQALLWQVAEKEMKIIKEEEHIQRVTTNMFSRMTPQQKEAAWVSEMSDHIFKRENDEREEKDEAEDGEEDDSKLFAKPVVRKKKTLQQRRKQKEQHALELARKAQKLEKRKFADINEMNRLKRKIAKLDEKQEKLSELRKKSKLIKARSVKRLAPTKFQDGDEDFNMASDISGNLRNLKKEGNLLLDRMKSLQKRNIVEPTVLRHVKKAKVKRFVKKSHQIEQQAVPKKKTQRRRRKVGTKVGAS